MALIRKPHVTARKRMANRLNGEGLRLQTRAGKAQAALRRPYDSRLKGVVLPLLGDDPAEFRQMLDSLMATYAPADALQMGLVFRIARALWRVNRYDRMGESMAARHLEHAQEVKTQVEAITLMPVFNQLERIKALFHGVCLADEPTFGPAEMPLFLHCSGDVPDEKARDILHCLLRLRQPGSAEEIPGLPEDAGQFPPAEGDERTKVCRQLDSLVAQEIRSREARLLGEPDDDQKRIDRDEMMAAGLPKAADIKRSEESSLRELWRTIHLLLKVQQAQARIEENHEK